MRIHPEKLLKVEAALMLLLQLLLVVHPAGAGPRVSAPVPVGVPAAQPAARSEPTTPAGDRRLSEFFPELANYAATHQELSQNEKDEFTRQLFEFVRQADLAERKETGREPVLANYQAFQNFWRKNGERILTAQALAGSRQVSLREFASGMTGAAYATEVGDYTGYLDRMQWFLRHPGSVLSSWLSVNALLAVGKVTGLVVLTAVSSSIGADSVRGLVAPFLRRFVQKNSLMGEKGVAAIMSLAEGGPANEAERAEEVANRAHLERTQGMLQADKADYRLTAQRAATVGNLTAQEQAGKHIANDAIAKNNMDWRGPLGAIESTQVSFETLAAVLRESLARLGADDRDLLRLERLQSQIVNAQLAEHFADPTLFPGGAAGYHELLHRDEQLRDQITDAVLGNMAPGSDPAETAEWREVAADKLLEMIRALRLSQVRKHERAHGLRLYEEWLDVYPELNSGLARKFRIQAQENRVRMGLVGVSCFEEALTRGRAPVEEKPAGAMP